jgi:alpha-beta hydrolase superfamily lysophospholipase
MGLRWQFARFGVNGPDQRRQQRMGTITTTDGTEIFYKDWGSGQPIVFSHGWPLSGDDWDTQMLFFLHHGYRVIAHDRRGHGRSTQTSDGHDMDHYADDLVSRALSSYHKYGILGYAKNWTSQSCSGVDRSRA